jgi:hypothetical protein
MPLNSRLVAVALASLLFTGTTLTQATAAGAKNDAKTAPVAATEKKAPKERSAESIECSKQADAKGLHGKKRDKFRRQCKKEAKAGAAAATEKK